MDTELLIDYFDRILGAFIFIAAVSILVFSINRMTTSVSQVKSDYVNDGVYSEAALAETDESKMSRGELTSLVMNCPNKNIVIQDKVSGYVISITCGVGLTNSVQIEQNDIFTSNAKIIVFGKDRWDNTQLSLDEWLQASSYKIKDIVNASGEVKNVFYYGEA